MNLPKFSEMSNDELMSFWSRYHRPVRKDARDLLGHSNRGYITTTEMLANYACNVAVQKQCEARGDEDAVAIYKLCAQHCLERLPEEVQRAVNLQTV